MIRNSMRIAFANKSPLLRAAILSNSKFFNKLWWVLPWSKCIIEKILHNLIGSHLVLLCLQKWACNPAKMIQISYFIFHIVQLLALFFYPGILHGFKLKCCFSPTSCISLFPNWLHDAFNHCKLFYYLCFYFRLKIYNWLIHCSTRLNILFTIILSIFFLIVY